MRGYRYGMQTSISAAGPASADLAWERYADLDRWSVWAPQITGVDAPSRRIAPGLRGTVRAAGLLHVPFEVLAVDETARTWSWWVRVGPIRLHLDHGVEDTVLPGGTGRAGTRAARRGTRTWLRTTGPAPVVLAYTPVAFVALHSLVLDR